jgi:sugar lactone lactonase YvrE
MSNLTMRRSRLLPTLAASILAVVLLAGLSGCGSSVIFKAVQTPGSYSGVTFNGKVMAGKQPLIGASVQLYSAGVSGNGSSGTALLATALTTDSNGAFTIPAGYLCPLPTSPVYVVARGGKPGSSATSANTAATLITALGACNQIAASSQTVVNEVTTAAAVYALSQFLSAGANLGASSTNTAGLANAFSLAIALADSSQGSSPGPSFAANGSSPAPKIDSVANLLDGCVASTASGPACSALFSATTPTGASAPTNTLDAALNLARNPAANVATLYTQSAASSAFSPVLSAAPSDWTLFVNYTGGGMNAPSGLGIDSAGNIWVASYFSVASEFSPLGKPLLPQGITGFGLSASYGLAVDSNGNAWIPNEPNPGYAGNSVSVFNSAGQSVAGGSGFTGGGLDYPIALAIDSDGSAWVADNGDAHLTHLSGSGQALSGANGYSSPLLAFPVAVAIDASHNVWVANLSPPANSPPVVTKVSSNGSQFNAYPTGDGPAGLAIDQLGNVWVANYYGNSVSELSSSGADRSNGGYTGGGLDHPQGIAVDSAGNVWIANYRAALLTELAGANAVTPGALLSPSAGLGRDAHLLEAYAIAVDASGNVWVSNFGSNTLTQFIGVASPVRTPLIGLPKAP